jgi:hypothetical protein
MGQNFFLNTARNLRQKIFETISFLFYKVAVFTFSKLPSVGIFLYYIKISIFCIEESNQFVKNDDTDHFN